MRHCAGIPLTASKVAVDGRAEDTDLYRSCPGWGEGVPDGALTAVCQSSEHNASLSWASGKGVQNGCTGVGYGLRIRIARLASQLTCTSGGARSSLSRLAGRLSVTI